MKGPDMAAPRIVLSLALAIATTAVVAPASSQEYRGTWEQQMACTPDVWRLCSDQVPDVNRIVGCLRQNTELLSTPCRAVFESNNSAPQPIAPRPQSRSARTNPPPPNPYSGDE
jgi:hypothetical protein